MQTIINWGSFGLALLGLGLSVWIVLPAPTLGLLTLAVGAPEVSLGLTGLGVLAMLGGWFQLRSLGSPTTLTALTLGFAGATIALSLLPIAQLPGFIAQSDRAMTAVIGEAPIVGRDRPLVLKDWLMGLPSVPIEPEPLAPGGRVQPMLIYRPQTSGPHPGLVVIYGGAWQRGSTANDGDLNQQLAAQGYVVIAIAYRHAPAYRFPAQIDDVEAALEYLDDHRSALGIRGKLALMGRSAGAHLAMLAAYRYPDRISAVVNYYGPVNLLAGYDDRPSPDPLDSRKVLEIFLGASPRADADAARYRQASPWFQVRSGLPPTLLIYGGRDHVVMSRFGRAMADRLRGAGNAAVFLEIPWAEHAFDAVDRGISSQVALYYTEQFLAWALAVR
jgi:acetyl esterase/lipase